MSNANGEPQDPPVPPVTPASSSGYAPSPPLPPASGYAPPPIGYNTQPAAVPAPGGDYPGRTLGIVGLILVFVFTLAGLICSIIALNQSRSAGYKNTPAFVGVVLSIVFMVLGIIATIVFFAVLVPAFYTACTTGQISCR